ncbi:MarR family winged helix-turn-helix transcriptional regulator [Jiella sp. M17.18]|uniref:MarR family winged helix-turn-helix transcriptional regulator n=1 Tax=Jiella sp. M17.18 TaxID=3234247 RepID=UPI0034DFE646
MRKRSKATDRDRQELDVRGSTLSKMIDRLERDGYVERNIATLDARIKLITLTPRGAEAKRQVREIWISMESELAKGIPLGELEEFCAGLQSTRNMLKRRVGRLR